MASEKNMAKAVARWLKSEKGLAALEISLGGIRFDVVAYDKKRRVFKVVECKLTKRETGIGKTFGQLVSYTGTLSRRAYDFVNAASKKLGRMSFNTWMEATSGGRKIQVEYYVALRDTALRDVDFLYSIRKQVPGVGIIRCRGDGRCRNNIWVGGKRNYDLPRAKTHTIRLRNPHHRFS
jgi:hypothetical protein